MGVLFELFCPGVHLVVSLDVGIRCMMVLRWDWLVIILVMKHNFGSPKKYW